MNPIYKTKQEFELANPGRSWEDYKSQYPSFQFQDNLGFDFTRNQNVNPFNTQVQDPFAFTDAPGAGIGAPITYPQNNNVNPQTGEITGLPQNNNWDWAERQQKEDAKKAEELRPEKYVGFDYENFTTADEKDLEKVKAPSFLDYLSQMPNLGMGISTDDKFKIAGMSMAYKPDFLNNSELEKKAKKANTVVGIAAGTSGILGAAKSVMQGMGIQKRQNDWSENYWKDQRDLQRPEYKYENGGEIPVFRYGGTFLDIPFSKMAIDEYISGLPKAMEEMANAEIEDEEWIIDPTNAVKKALGHTHEKGGIKTVLQPGTKVVSDNLKLGAKLAKELNNEVDLKVKMNHTYAEVIDKYNRKIGLEEKNLELEKLYKKLEKNDNITNESTRRLNETFLTKEIEKAEQDRQRLLEARAVFANKIYNKQQEGKLEKFENGGMFKGGTFEALCKKYGLTKEQGLDMLKQYEDGGQQMEQPQAPQQMDEETVKQIIEMYSQMVNMSPEQLNEQFLGMSEEQLNEEIMRMSQELQQANVMKYGGKILPQYKDGDPYGKIKAYEGDKNNKKNASIHSTKDWQKLAETLGFEGGDNAAFQRFLLNNTDNLQIVEAIKKLHSEDEGHGKPNSGDKWDDGFLGYRWDKVFDALSKEPTPTPAKEQPKVVVTEVPKTKEEITQSFKNSLEDLEQQLRTKSKPDNGMLFVPDTINLPPDGIFPHVKREFRTELVDPMAISAESILRENYRTQETSNMNLDNLPIGMRGAANANLTAITQENNLKADLEKERFNAQNKQQVEQANVQLNNQREMMRYNEIPRYEALQLTAMEKTKNDLYNYFNAGIENEMNEFNYKNSYNITKSMFPEITTDMFGVPIVKQDTRTYFDNTYSKKEEPKKKGK